MDVDNSVAVHVHSSVAEIVDNFMARVKDNSVAEAKDVDKSMVGAYTTPWPVPGTWTTPRYPCAARVTCPVIHKLLGSLLLWFDSWT